MKYILFLFTTFLLMSCSSNEQNEKSASLNSDSLNAALLKADTSAFGLKMDTLVKLPEEIKFNVADVPIAKELLNTHPSKQLFENKLGKKIMFIPIEHANLQLVNTHYNGLIHTLQYCYDQHRPLVLSPDVIWLAIIQSVSIHVNKNFTKLEKKLFKENKPKTLIARNDSLSFATEHWEDLINQLAQQTKSYTNEDYYSFFVPQFSTTTKIQTTAFQITLLNTYKKAFAYVGESGCGIPYIRLIGNKSDWELIYAHLDHLDLIGLTNWKNELKPLLKEFINVYDNKINTLFWQSIYKNMSDYNAFYISGWILKLFPYIEQQAGSGQYDEEIELTRLDKKYFENKFIYGNKHVLSNLSTDDFPSGIVDIDLTWNNYIDDETKKLKIYSGYFGIKQHNDKGLEPLISWAICEKDAKKIIHKINDPYIPKKLDQDDFWTPFIVSKISQPAIYNPKKFATQEESIEFIRTNLVNALQSKFKKESYASDTLSFIVLSNGLIENIEFTGEKKELNFIKNYLTKLDSEWFPALADPTNVFMMWSEVGDEKVDKIKVNSKIVLPL